MARPTAAQLDAQPDDQPISEPIVGYTTTDSSGNYSASVSDTGTLSREADSSGQVGLDVTLASDSLSAASSFTDTYNAASNTLTQASTSDEAGDSAPVALNLSASPRTPTSNKPNAMAVSSSITPSQSGCTMTPKGTIGNGRTDTTVARIYGTIAASRGKVSYTSNAHTELGIGVSLDGKSWKAQGSETFNVGDITTETPGTKSGPFATAANTYFKLKKFLHICTDTSTGTVWLNQYETHATNYVGGLHYADLSSTPSTPYCLGEASGYTVTKSSSHATTVSGGVSTSSVIGINLNAKTGYSKSASVTLSLSGGSGRICGSNDTVGGSPGILAIRAS